MRFETTQFEKNLDYKKISLDFGTFYLCNSFFVSEINNDIHLDEVKVEHILHTLVAHYGKNASVTFISNRINSYSSDPQLWVNMLTKYDIFNSGVIVFYNLSNLMNFEIERHICPKDIKGFSALTDAINWAMQLKKVKSN